MNKYKETFNTWNNIAQPYEAKFMDLTLYNKSYDLFCDALAKGKLNVLELGCGPGNISKYLLSKRPDIDLLGIDIAPNMVKLAKNNNPTANFKVMDVRNINLLNNFFDGIICGFTLPYLSKPDAEKLIVDCKNRLTHKGII